MFKDDSDLMRIIQQNFFYDSQNQKCILNYENITNQIIDRFFKNKQLIDIKVLN